jgi:hypothetical protein
MNNVISSLSPPSELNGCFEVRERAAASEVEYINDHPGPPQGIDLIGHEDAVLWTLRAGPHVGDY